MPANAAAKARGSSGWRTGSGIVVAVELAGESGEFWFISETSEREAGERATGAGPATSIYRSPPAQQPQARWSLALRSETCSELRVARSPRGVDRAAGAC